MLNTLMKNFNFSDIKLAVIGLGYVGLPLVIEFSKKFKVVGFDSDIERIDELKNGYDRTKEINNSQLRNLSQLKLSNDSHSIVDSNIYIITVPTPVNKKNQPDLSPLLSATKTVAQFIQKNNIIIYESTVFPGCTEDICVPLIEKISKLKYNVDFFAGYSPERINPGDTEHSLINVKKLTSGSNKKVADFIDELYSSIIKAGTYQASSINVAEAAKVIENTQRDVNIALINELSVIFNKLNLDTVEVLEAAETKWNFLPFRPGLVGGHCIGVDPYYLTYKAVQAGYVPDIVLAGRKINDNMGCFIADNVISELDKQGFSITDSRITILGLSFKENCPDFRNTKVLTIIERLKEMKCDVSISDYYVNASEVKKKLGIKVISLDKVTNQDAIVIAVGHEKYLDLNLKNWQKMLKPKGVIVDVKSIYEKDAFESTNYKHWRL